MYGMTFSLSTCPFTTFCDLRSNNLQAQSQNNTIQSSISYSLSLYPLATLHHPRSLPNAAPLYAAGHACDFHMFSELHMFSNFHTIHGIVKCVVFLCRQGKICAKDHRKHISAWA